MQPTDIRVFIPTQDYQESQAFYQALGFAMNVASDKLSIFSLGECTFFLQDYFDPALASSLMLQLIVNDIDDAFETIKSISSPKVKYQPIKQEPWGKVIYLWGPAGELWHITQLNAG